MTRRTRIALAFGAAVGLATAPALAEDVDLDFGFTDHTGSTNNMSFTVDVERRNIPPFNLTFSDSDTQASDVIGNALSTLSIAFGGDGSVAAVNSLQFTGGQVEFADNMTFDLVLVPVIAEITATTTGLGGQLQTLGPASPVNASGNFDLAFHQINVNQGQLNATGVVTESFDFAAAPLVAPLTGTASIAVSLDSVINGQASYTATLTTPVSFTQSIDPDVDTTVDITATGTLLATDTFSRELYMPGDITGDDFVGGEDLDVLFANWGQTVASAGFGGDLSGDGVVGEADLAFLLASWSDGSPPAGLVPEPGSLALLGLCSLGLLRRRR